MTAVLLLINPPCFLLTLSERLSVLSVQLILSPLLVSSFLFPHCEQPGSRQLIRRRARSFLFQWPVVCKHLPLNHAKASSLIAEKIFDAPDRYLRQDSAYRLHYLSERDGKWVIRERGGVGRALLTWQCRGSWVALGKLGSLGGARIVCPRPGSVSERAPGGCWAAGAEGLFAKGVEVSS